MATVYICKHRSLKINISFNNFYTADWIKTSFCSVFFFHFFSYFSQSVDIKTCAPHKELQKDVCICLSNRRAQGSDRSTTEQSLGGDVSRCFFSCGKRLGIIIFPYEMNSSETRQAETIQISTDLSTAQLNVGFHTKWFHSLLPPTKWKMFS